jgi:hypothetical protein
MDLNEQSRRRGVLFLLKGLPDIQYLDFFRDSNLIG